MGDLFLLMPSMSSSHCLFEQFAGTVTHQCQPDSSWDRFLADLLLKAGTLTRLISIFKILSFCQFSSYKNFIILKIHQKSTRNSMQPLYLVLLCPKTHSGVFFKMNIRERDIGSDRGIKALKLTKTDEKRTKQSYEEGGMCMCQLVQ